MSPFLFTVLTDFKFEIGAALLGTKNLQGAVSGLSGAADEALVSFQKLGAGIAINMGLGAGGIASVLQVAVQAADKYQQSQLSFANLISSNKDHLVGPIDTFAERLKVSDMIMGSIAKKAQQFALPTGDLIEMTKTISAVLIPKGLAGENLSTSVDLSRNLLKSAPNLGIDPGEVQGQLLRTIEGSASMGDTLFRRLASETSAFKGFQGGNAAKQFNTLPAAKRVDLLGKALQQFASDTDVLRARATSLSGAFQQLKQLLSPTEYVTNIFRPIGEVLIPLIVNVLSQLAEMLKTHGAEIVKNLAFFAKDFLKSPEQLVVNLMQLRAASDDVKTTKSILGIIGLITGIGHALKFLGLTASIAGPFMTALSYFGMGLAAGFSALIPILGKLLLLLAPFAILFIKVLAIMAVVFALVQLFSRARAIATVADAKELPRQSAEFSKSITLLKQVLMSILGPFLRLFDSIAQALSWLFRLSFWFDLLNATIYLVAYGLSYLQSAFMGLLSSVQAFMTYITSSQMVTNPLGLANAMSEAFGSTFEENMRRNLTVGGEDPNVQNPVAMQNINIAKVEIRNDFKEQQEPDRVAFTIKDQLMKAAVNRGQSRGRSLSTGLVGA